MGLSGGNAVLRLIHRKPDTLTEQANVVNITNPTPKSEENVNWRPMRKEEDDVSLKIFEKAKETEIKPPEGKFDKNKSGYTGYSSEISTNSDLVCTSKSELDEISMSHTLKRLIIL